MEKKRIRLREIRRDMDGMSPKLGLWQKLKAEAEQIGRELAELGAQRVRTHLERIQKHEMEFNTIYVFMEEGSPTAKARASNDQCYAVSAPTNGIAIESVANSLYDVEQGGDGHGSSRQYRPPTFTYPIVYLQ